MSGFSLTAGQSLFGQLIAWSLLPPILSNILLRILISTGIVLPAKSPQQQQTYANRARAAVILLYLGHNILQTVQNAPINHYGLLGLPSGTEATEEEIKRRYRLLARVYHPDKAEFSGDANAANMFMQIRSAVELLSDPDKRAAYDRFGPEVLTWSEAVTLREYMRTGLQQSLVWYAVNQGMYWAVQYLNGSRQNKFTSGYGIIRR
ncbi:DnaJ-domain-containing protein [Tilletiaria anomala UBC 951]|uniref:DnaJ-domain-containing protein n=1 Tax=Tilletiaria anomala (strain ATCC 24038 / CBS 436.72 / UBC 951) TaxID=1037660 RepID=A0A066VFZ9_TILAU|nr:DnaJ-domain-containing protein [Tilletiaria anomala UBC 951]KDN40361.1 DnaJ-domain-containing protein [Tilletiaria anomala UBC 951]